MAYTPFLMEIDSKNLLELKKRLGERAAELVDDGMLVGLGTGSTADCFIESLCKRVQGGLSITAVASSERSAKLAKEGGIPLVDMSVVRSIDLTIDSADEVDPQNRMIKGGGGAHVREKILASASKKLVIIVDASKLVSHLGTFPLPVEIIPFGYLTTLAKIKRLGYKGRWRMREGKFFVTDNGNYLFDINQPKKFTDPKQDHLLLKALPGVVDTGFFVDLPLELLVAYPTGEVEFRKA